MPQYNPSKTKNKKSDILEVYQVAGTPLTYPKHELLYENGQPYPYCRNNTVPINIVKGDVINVIEPVLKKKKIKGYREYVAIVDKATRTKSKKGTFAYTLYIIISWGISALESNKKYNRVQKSVHPYLVKFVAEAINKPDLLAQRKEMIQNTPLIIERPIKITAVNRIAETKAKKLDIIIRPAYTKR